MSSFKLLKIHLGDQTDSKLLLGTYVQTSPGCFKWKQGILTNAVTQGRWVLVEDLDLAPVDVVAILSSLLETGELFIASRGERIKASKGFRIFATRRVDSVRLKEKFKDNSQVTTLLIFSLEKFCLVIRPPLPLNIKSAKTYGRTYIFQYKMYFMTLGPIRRRNDGNSFKKIPQYP